MPIGDFFQLNRLDIKRLVEKLELADKPGSVLGNHSSRPAIAHWLQQHTRSQRGPRRTRSYLVLLRVEFTLPHTVASGAVRSYRTLSPLPVSLTDHGHLGGLLSAALVVGLRRPGVTWHPAHWSPDFPPLYPYTFSLHLRYHDKAAIVWSTRGAFYLLSLLGASRSSSTNGEKQQFL